MILHSHWCLSETGDSLDVPTPTTQSSSSSSSPPNDNRLLFFIFFPDFTSFCSSGVFSPPSLFFFLLELAVMPWNLSSDERLAGFLNRIFPSAGESSPVEKMNESSSAQCGGVRRRLFFPLSYVSRWRVSNLHGGAKISKKAKCHHLYLLKKHPKWTLHVLYKTGSWCDFVLRAKYNPSLTLMV